MPQQLTKVKGVYTYPSEVTEIPDGGLVACTNVVVERESIAEPRRGFNNYKAISSTASDRAKTFLIYQDTLLAHFGTTIARDVSNPFTAYSGSFSEPVNGDSFVPRLKFFENNSNLYFTSNNGIQKLSSLSGSISSAGVVRALDVIPSLTGSSGFLPNNSQVAYRALFGIKDVNNNLVLGAPSQRVVLANSSGGSRDVSLNLTIPDTITTSHFVQVYRTAASGGSSIDPGDECRLVYEANPTSAEISAKQLTFVDTRSEDLLGASLYTNPSQEGIGQANDQPPQAKDVALFKQMSFYANTKTKHRLFITLLGAGGDLGVNFRSLSCDTQNGQFTILNMSSITGLAVGMRLTGAGFAGTVTITSVNASFTQTGTTGLGSPIITGLSSTTNMRVGQSVSGINIPAASEIVSIDSPTQITINNNATGAGAVTLTFGAWVGTSSSASSTNTGSTYTFFDVITLGGVEYYASSAENVTNREFQVFNTGSVALDIYNTSISFLKVVNRAASNTTVYGSYLSGADDLPGRLLFEARTLAVSSFTMTASSHGSAWSPVLPLSGSSVSSVNDEWQNALYISKIQQPEAVPLLQYVRIGGGLEPIYRILPLRDSLIILKADGVYRLTGDSPSSIVVEILDNTVQIRAPESAVILNNQVYCLTNQGVVSISDAGVGVISRNIEDAILDILQLANVQTQVFGVSYETSRQYQLWFPTAGSDTAASQCWVYNLFTQAWTRWEKSAKCAVVSTGTDKLYLGPGDSNVVREERKTNSYNDYVDEDLPVTITAVTDNQVTLSSASGVSVGDALIQGTLPFSIITAVVGNVLTVEVARPYSIAAATVQKAYVASLSWAPHFMGNPGTSKQIREIKLLLKSSLFTEGSIRFSTDIVRSEAGITLSGYSSTLWGYFAWGSVPWGGVSGLDKRRTYIPSIHQRCTWINTTWETKRAFSQWAVSGLHYTFEFMSERTSVV